MDGTIEYPLYMPDELAGAAWAAMSRQDADEALRLWQALREHSPERPDGHIWPVQILWQRGRFDEAEALAARSITQFPDEPELLVQRAWIAAAQRNWARAAQRWKAVRIHAAERLEGYVWGARALWSLGKLDAAEALASEAVRRFPGDVNALSESCWIATAREDWPEALRRWTLMHEAEPQRIDAQARMIQSLRMLGRNHECEVAATTSLAEHPDEPELLIEHVWAAVAREDWEAAAARLDAARAHEKVARLVAEAFAGVEPQIRASAAIVAAQKASADKAAAAKELMLKFESLGERCDFGAVQRHFGVEPLGLLRFAWTRLHCLLMALDDRFDAIGTVEDTGFEAYGDETVLRMRKYDLIFEPFRHTFVNEVKSEPVEKREVSHEQQRRRLLFLKDKLVRDLENAEKIWVFATGDAAASADTDVAKLFSALHAYGANSLLYVRVERDGHPAGTVEALGGGLYAGYFPGPVDFVAGEQPPFELWRELCARTYQLIEKAS
ncbi:MAG TPA: tetratricopeptide repeat protein [Stellaceae bacterium]|nr:tetratricopeptide repeat protein [Stellaceae bacterium]